MNDYVAITGIGIINPLGIGKDAFWDKMIIGANGIKPISRFDTTDLSVKVAGEITDFKVNDFVPRRLAVKMDRFAHYAVAAATLALDDSQLSLEKYDPYRIGVWFGNNAGGWDICERGLFELYRDGAPFVNPWQATAWFPTSPQGYVSICHGLKGMSKSFICDRASSASAMSYATNAILTGQCDIILAGGTEAPLTPFGTLCYREIGVLADTSSDTTVYKPFSDDACGGVLGEGSTVLVLERYEHAVARGATIYGKIYRGAMTTDPDRVSNRGYINAQKKALRNANVSVDDIDVIFPEAAALPNCDQLEATAINELFATNAHFKVAFPKARFGHLYGASTATDIAVGLLAAQHGQLPASYYSKLASFASGWCVNHTVEHTRDLNNLLFNSRAREGTNVSMLVSTTI